MMGEEQVIFGIFEWVWEQYGREFTDRAVRAAWNRIRWQVSAANYVRKIHKLYGTMQILGQARPVSLTNIYTKVQLLDRPSASRPFTPEEMEAEFRGQRRRYFHAQHSDETRHDGLEMVRGNKNLLILGKPGAGKTTFLKHVALQAAAGRLDFVPIFVSLKQLADSDLKLFDYVVEEFAVCDFPDAAPYIDRLLKTGKAIVLLDGLDEVNVTDDVQQRLTRDIQQFIRKYNLCRYLITYRLAAVEYQFVDFTHVEMADFDELQVREFVGRWFLGGGEQKRKRELFLREWSLPRSEGLRELARVPLLLALLCLSFEGRPTLAERRVKLYEEAFETLLKKWDASRNIWRDEVYRELSPRHKQQMLAQVAAGSFDRGQYFFGRRALAAELETFLRRMPNVPDEIDGEVVLQAITAQHGLFVERAEDVYSFPHLTFQEYLTARYIVDDVASGSLPRLMKHVTDSRWREVFLLTAGSLPNANVFFDLFLKRLVEEVEGHPAVGALLRQAKQQSAAAEAEGLKAAAVCSYYLGLALLPARAHNLARVHDLARVLALARARFLALDLDLNHDLARVLAFNPALALTLDLDLARALKADLNLDLALTLDRNPHHQMALDGALVNVWLLMVTGIEFQTNNRDIHVLGPLQALLAVAVRKSELLGLAELVALLGQLALPTHESSVVEWQAVAEQLEGVLEQRGMAAVELSTEDFEALYRYLEANRLLLDCLQQAVVTDRAAIEERLLVV